MKRQAHIRVSQCTDDQIADLVVWWRTTITGAIQECVSRAWHVERAHREDARDPPWVVFPTWDLFPDEPSAIRWLEDVQQAARVGPSEWVTLDEDGNPSTQWTLQPGRYTK